DGVGVAPAHLHQLDVVARGKLGDLRYERARGSGVAVLVDEAHSRPLRGLGVQDNSHDRAHVSTSSRPRPEAVGSPAVQDPGPAVAMFESQNASSSSAYACPRSCSEAKASDASRSSIFDKAKPTWMSTQSPGWTSSSSSSPMLTVRLTPETSTAARCSWLSSSSTTWPGIPRHIAAPPSPRARYSIDSSVRSAPPTHSVSPPPQLAH